MPLTETVLKVFLESPIWWLLFGALLVSIALRSSVIKGFVGELKIRFATDFLLDGKIYHPLHDVTLDTKDGTTQIDHLVVSKFGVFVIETKNLKGWIFGDAKSKKWTQSLFRKKYQFQNPLHQNYKHLKAVEELLRLEPGCLHSVVVFVGSSRFKTLMPANVIEMRGFLPYLRSKADLRLSSEEVENTIRSIKRAQISGFGVRRQHVRRLKTNSENPLCPRCGEAMVLRTAKKGRNVGGQFWGCSRYPNCRAVKDVA